MVIFLIVSVKTGIFDRTDFRFKANISNQLDQ